MRCTSNRRFFKLWIGMGMTVLAMAGFIFIIQSISSKSRVAQAVDSPLSWRDVVTGRRPLERQRWRDLAGSEDEILNLGSARMEWSSGGQGIGYLYTWDVENHRSHVWSFAPCRKSAFDELSNADWTGRFYGYDSPGGMDAFGARWNTNAVQVLDGMMLLARHADDPRTVYALKIEKQNPHLARIRFEILDAVE